MIDPMPPPSPRRIKVFLCHSSTDKPPVRDLYRKLKNDGFQPWLDEEDLTPGQAWRETIDDAVRSSDAVVVCISRSSVNKEGFLQKEIKTAVDVADEKPEGTIFVIPARLEEVEVPRRLRELQWVNLYEKGGYERLVLALQERARISPGPPDAKIRPLSEDPGINVKPIRFEVTLNWVRSHTLVVGTVSLIVLASILVAFRLYQVQARYKKQAILLMSQAAASLRSFDTFEAQSLLRQAVTADPNNAVAHANLAIAFAESGNYILAQKEAQLAMNFKSKLNAIDRSWVEGVWNETNWRLGAAAKSYRETRRTKLEGALRLARVQTLSGNGTDALQTLSELKTLSDESTDPRIDYERALAAGSEKNLDDEIKTLETIVNAHASDFLVVAAARSQKCWALFRQNHFELAKADCEDALQLFNRGGYRLGAARTLSRKSLILAYGDKNTDEAMKLLDEAWQIVQELGSQLDEAGVLENRSNLWLKLGKYDPARKDHEAAAAIYDQIGNKQGLADLQNNWGWFHVKQCNYEDAKTAYESSLKALEDASRSEGGTPNSAIQSGIATANSNIGWMQYLLGNLSDAERSLEDALQTRASLKLAPDSNSLITLADVEMAEGKLDSAEQCLRGKNCFGNTFQSADDHGDAKVLPDGLIDFALLKIETGSPGSAVNIASEQYKEAQQQGDPDDKADAIDALARALIVQGGIAHLNEARRYVQQAPLKINSCWLSASLSITAARVNAHLNDFELAREQLANARQIADQSKLFGYQMEALLAEAEVEFLAGNVSRASDLALELFRQSEGKGYVLISRKAYDLLRKIHSQ